MDDVNGDPSSWEEALVRAGYTDRRGGNGPSWSALAEKLGVHEFTTSDPTALAAGKPPEHG